MTEKSMSYHNWILSASLSQYIGSNKFKGKLPRWPWYFANLQICPRLCKIKFANMALRTTPKTAKLIAAKNLNISMSPCANRNLFWQNWSPLIFIPYRRHEQTAPSWIAGKLKFFNLQKQRNCSEKPEYLHGSLCKSESVSTEFMPELTAKCITYNRHEQTAPSWLAGQLNFFNQQKQRKWNEKPP